jgi:hypothetical protein
MKGLISFYPLVSIYPLEFLLFLQRSHFKATDLLPLRSCLLPDARLSIEK